MSCFNSSDIGKQTGHWGNRHCCQGILYLSLDIFMILNFGAKSCGSSAMSVLVLAFPLFFVSTFYVINKSTCLISSNKNWKIKEIKFHVMFSSCFEIIDIANMI